MHSPEPPSQSAGGPPVERPDRRRWTMRRIAVSWALIAGAYVSSQLVGLSVGATVAVSSGRADDAQEWLQQAGDNGLILAVLTLVSTSVCMPVVLWLTARVEARPWAFLGFARAAWRDFVVPGAALLGLLAAYEGVNWMLGRSHIHLFVAEAYASAGSVALLTLSLVVAAPLVEETAFRGFLFSTLRQRHGAAACALVTAVLWSVVHVQYDALEQGYIFVLGVLLAWARVRSRSLLVPIYMHAAVNMLAIAQVAFAA